MNTQESMETTTLDEIRGLHIAHTDTGDYFMFNGELKKEFLVKGKITKIRAGLLFLEIDGEKFSAHKQEGFEAGEEVICYIIPKMKEGIIEFTVRSLEKL